MPSPPLPDYLWAVLGAKYAASDGDVLAAARAVGRSARWARAQLELYPAIADAVARREQSSEVDTAAGKAPTNELDDERLGPRAPCAFSGSARRASGVPARSAGQPRRLDDATAGDRASDPLVESGRSWARAPSIAEATSGICRRDARTSTGAPFLIEEACQMRAPRLVGHRASDTVGRVTSRRWIVDGPVAVVGAAV
jgi:hypothetical protein